MPDKEHNSVFIVSGETGSGKTTFVMRLIEVLQGQSLSITGFTALSVPHDGPSGSFNMLDLDSGKIIPLASRRFYEGWEQVGNFFFNPEGIGMGKRILEDALKTEHDILVVDEIGPFELEGKIWAESLTPILERRVCPVLLVVRQPLVAAVVQKWNLQDAVLINIRQLNPDQAADLVFPEPKGADD